MKVLALLCLVAAVTAAEDPLAYYRNYHENIGIPLAKKIKAVEDAHDFDGSVSTSGRIWGGSAASVAETPYLAGLIIDLTNGQQSVCGCSIVSETAFLTAAHCWRTTQSQARQFEIVMGATTLFYGGTRVKTTNVQTHGSYDPWWLTSDIAMAKTSRVNLGGNIQKVALPPSSLTNLNGYWGTAAGYGQVGNQVIQYGQIRRKADIQVADNSVCRNLYTNTVISSTLCCVTNSGRSTCPGDSGGPLTVMNGNTRVLAGVVSFGHVDGCHLGYPVGFARVTSFLSWIQQRL